MSFVPRQLPLPPFDTLPTIQPSRSPNSLSILHTYIPSSLLTPPGLTSHSPFPTLQDTHPVLPYSSSSKRIQSRRWLLPFVSIRLKTSKSILTLHTPALDARTSLLLSALLARPLDPAAAPVYTTALRVPRTKVTLHPASRNFFLPSSHAAYTAATRLSRHCKTVLPQAQCVCLTLVVLRTGSWLMGAGRGADCGREAECQDAVRQCVPSKAATRRPDRLEYRIGIAVAVPDFDYAAASPRDLARQSRVPSRVLAFFVFRDSGSPCPARPILRFPSQTLRRSCPSRRDTSEAGWGQDGDDGGERMAVEDDGSGRSTGGRATLRLNDEGALEP
ncbi:hypothetical protein R3P38DRAFT_3173307 [Favolaschia claudopus]|uniref:Uncharacterized protein n=1 Tax=Favolaschia claudopus TaxID=2862362 RepID=A0AAW0DIN4_9AGAR